MNGSKKDEPRAGGSTKSGQDGTDIQPILDHFSRLQADVQQVSSENPAALEEKAAAAKRALLSGFVTPQGFEIHQQTTPDTFGQLLAGITGAGTKKVRPSGQNGISEKTADTAFPDKDELGLRIPMTNRLTPLESALTYFEAGFVPFPVSGPEKGGKQPLVKGYRQLTRESINREWVDQHFKKKSAVNVGLILQDNHVVIDLDSKPDKGETARKFFEGLPQAWKACVEDTAGGLHVHLLCPDFPIPAKRAPLVAKVNELLAVEVMFRGLPITVAPSVHTTGTPYEWRSVGALPVVTWKEMEFHFGFGAESVQREAQKTARTTLREFRLENGGDLTSLDIVELFKEIGLYGQADSHYAGKHSVRCPFHEEHADDKQAWSTEDCSTVIFEGKGGKLPGFKCLHAHCSDRQLENALRRIEEMQPGIVRKHCKRTMIWTPDQERPQIELPGSGRAQIDFAEEVGQAITFTHQVFRFGEGIVVIDANDGQVNLSLVGKAEAVTAFERFVEFGQRKKDGDDEKLVTKSMSKEQADILLAAQQFKSRLPRIDRVLQVPIPHIYRGEIITPCVGYDERFHTFLNPDAPRIIEMGRDEALDVIEDLLGNEDGRGFAWKDAQAKTAAVARLLTSYCRGLMDWGKVPVFLLIANQPRVGKDTFVYMVQVIFTGKHCSSPPLEKRNDEEMRKRITAMLLSGGLFVHFANMKGHIDFPSLEAATDASTSWRDRILGQSVERTIPNFAEYSMSANLGATWSPDLNKRAVIIELFYSGEDVNGRQFRHPNVLEYALDNRSRILGACDALVLNWDRCGRPAGPTGNASFPRWGKIVGGIMHAAGLGDPCIPRRDESGVGGDQETQDMRRLFELAHQAFGNAFVQNAEIHKLLKDSDETLFPYLDLNTTSGKTSLGIKLEKFRDRELSGIFLRGNTNDRNRKKYAFRREPGSSDEEPHTSQTCLEGPKERSASSQDSLPAHDQQGCSEVMQTLQTLQTCLEGTEIEPSSSKVHPETVGAVPIQEDNIGVGANVCDVCDVCTDTPVPYSLISRPEQMDSVLAKLRESTDRPVAIDIETYGPGKDGALDPWRGNVRLLQIHAEGYDPVIVDVPGVKERFPELLEALLDRTLVGHNLGFDLTFLDRHFGFKPSEVFCTMTAAKILSAGLTGEKHDLASVTKRHLGIRLEKGFGASDWSGELYLEQLRYAALDVAHLLKLRAALGAELEQAGLAPTAELEMQMVLVAVALRINGQACDKDRLLAIQAEAEQAMQAAEKETYGIAGREFNIRSPQQLTQVFASFGISLSSTGEEALGEIDHELADVVLEYRRHQKLAQKCKELAGAIQVDGRIHAQFDPMGARTGRFSSSKPNMQNIPHGPIRSALVAASGNCRIRADYSQIELRVAAEIAGENRMINAFKCGEDLHRLTASLVLGINPAEVTKEQRQMAKAVNFGLLYGQSAGGLVAYAKTTYGVEMSEEDAEEFRKRFFDSYPRLAAWHQRMKDASNEGRREARTKLHRRRLIPHGTKWWPTFTTLVNTPVQGTAADGMKRALWKLHQELPDGSTIISTIHDEVVVEARLDLAEQATELVESAMKEAMAEFLEEVPVDVDVQVQKPEA